MLQGVPQQGWATIVVKRGERTLWEEKNCWATLAAVLPTLETVVYIGPRKPYIMFARSFNGKLLWEKEVMGGAFGPDELLAAGRYSIAMGRNILGRHVGPEAFWSKLIDVRTGRILWSHTNRDIGKPIFMDQQNVITVRKSLRSEGQCFLERRHLLTCRVLARYPAPDELYGLYREIGVNPGVDSVNISNAWIKPTFSRTIPHVHPVQATIYTLYLNLPGNVRVIHV